MAALLTYSGISTKLRSMKSRLLTEKDYHTLAYLKTIPEAVDFLKQKPAYRDVLSETHAEELHRSTLEHLLFNAVHADFSKIYRFSGVQIQKYLRMHFLDYEALLLKKSFQYIFDKRKINIDLPVFEDFFLKHSKLDLTKISESKTILELLEALRGSDYYSMLKRVSEYPNVTLFDYEMSIDSYVFSQDWKLKGKYYKGIDFAILEQGYGYRFDLLNIMWIYRAKKYYHLPVGDIYRLLLPMHYKLNISMIQNLTEASTLQDYFTVLQHTYYGKKYAHFLSSPEDCDLESLYYARMNACHLANFKNHPYSIACVSSYLYLKQLENEKLTTMLECIRYAVPPLSALELIHKYNPEVPI